MDALVFFKFLLIQLSRKPSCKWVSRRNLLFQGLIFRFHVELRGCTTTWRMGSQWMQVVINNGDRKSPKDRVVLLPNGH